MDVKLQQTALANLEALKNATGSKQSELAEIAGISHVQMNRIFNGHNDLTLDHCQRLAEHFGLAANALCQPTFMFEKNLIEILHHIA